MTLPARSSSPNLLLSAAQAGRPLAQVYAWLTRENDDEPVRILEASGLEQLASSLQAMINAPKRQRCGIYGTGKQMCAFMTNRQAMRWVTPARLAGREFHPAEFVTGRGILYSLSKEGKGSCAALVTALTVVAVTEAGEQLAKRSPLGRLPDLYSHYGSRGIVLSTILQSFAQGVEVWGRTGMEKLWSASTIKLYGGGGAEVEFLEQLSRLIGEYDLHTGTSTHSQGRHGRSISVSVRRERILDVSDLAALPRGRLIVLASGCRPTPAQPCRGCNAPTPTRSASQSNITTPAPHSPPTTGVVNHLRQGDGHDRGFAVTVELGEWTDTAAESREGPALYYATLEAFVCDYLLQTYRRPVSATSSTWCAEWWRHPEAIVRLEALWRSWEHLRLDPAIGISVWLRDHADHHMTVLLSSDGPFKGCTEKSHATHHLTPLRSKPAPDGLFDPIQTAVPEHRSASQDPRREHTQGVEVRARGRGDPRRVHRRGAQHRPRPLERSSPPARRARRCASRGHAARTRRQRPPGCAVHSGDSAAPSRGCVATRLAWMRVPHQRLYRDRGDADQGCPVAIVAVATYTDGEGGTFVLHANLVRESAGWEVFNVAEAPPHIPPPKPLSEGPRGC